jgi:hypothetical protein
MGFGARVSYAFRSFFALLFSGELPKDILAAVGGTSGASAAAVATPTPPAVDEGDRAVQLLAILQRDGRLVDFFQEDISPYTDAQIGAAARDVHEQCRAVLARYVSLEPVMSDAEGARVRLDGADPARIKLVGAVSGGAQEGVVQHRGWRVTRVALPPLPQEAERRIVAPAEIEVA